MAKHRVFMPPKMKPVPKGPILPDFKTKIRTRPNPKKRVKADGGPWDNAYFDTRVPDGGLTMVIQIGGFKGRYRVYHGFKHLAIWEAIV